LAVRGGFDVPLTVDGNLSHQQEVSGFDIAVVVRMAQSNTLAALRPLMPPLLRAFETVERGCVTVVGS
jgi:hypothetical protein